MVFARSWLIVILMSNFWCLGNSWAELCDLKVSGAHFRAMESYLERVLQKEMGGGFHLEALKAQAVAARTVTLLKLKQGKVDPAADDFGLSSQQASVSRDTPISSVVAEAVKATAGQVLLNDQTNSCLQYPFYHSHCGSDLLEPDEVWAKSGNYGLTNRAICTHHSSPAGKSVAMTWNYKIKKSSLISVLANYQFSSATRANYQIEKLRGHFRAEGDRTELSSGDRVEFFELLVIDKRSGKRQSLQLPGNAFRSLMPKQPPNLFKSTLIEQVSIARSDNTSLSGFLSEKAGVFFDIDLLNLPSDALIHFEGRGFGHGAGLCQYGANGAARDEGLIYHDILYRYFPNLTIAGIVRN